MSKSWPVEEFNTYLRQLMDAAGVKDYAELHRLTGVSQNQFSNWRRGLARPSRDLLRKIAPALGLNSPVMLFIAAGHDDHEELQLEPPDFTVLPQAFQDLREVYEQLDRLGRGGSALDAIRLILPALRNELEQVKAIERDRSSHTSGRPRRAG